jgi:hypothetical protein
MLLCYHVIVWLQNTLPGDTQEVRHILEGILTMQRTGRLRGYPADPEPLSLRDVAVLFRTKRQVSATNKLTLHCLVRQQTDGVCDTAHTLMAYQHH